MMYIHWIIFVLFLYNVNGGKKYIIKTAGEDDGVRQAWKKIIPLRAPEVGNQNYSADFIYEIRYTEEINNINNHDTSIQKKFLLQQGENLLFQQI